LNFLRPSDIASCEKRGMANGETSAMIQPGKIDGGLSGEGLRFRDCRKPVQTVFITERLLQGAVDALETPVAPASKGRGRDSRAGRVLNCRLAGEKTRGPRDVYDALIAIGLHTAGAKTRSLRLRMFGGTSRGLQLAQMDTGIPLMFCVLTCDTLEQAIDRRGIEGRQTKGFEAGLGAIEMAAVVAASCAVSSKSTHPPRAKGGEIIT